MPDPPHAWAGLFRGPHPAQRQRDVQALSRAASVAALKGIQRSPRVRQNLGRSHRAHHTHTGGAPPPCPVHRQAFRGSWAGLAPIRLLDSSCQCSKPGSSSSTTRCTERTFVKLAANDGDGSDRFVAAISISVCFQERISGRISRMYSPSMLSWTGWLSRAANNRERGSRGTSAAGPRLSRHHRRSARNPLSFPPISQNRP
jgi:hypothetical protein